MLEISAWGPSLGITASGPGGSLSDTASDWMPLHAQTSSDKGVHDGVFLAVIWVSLPRRA